MMLLEQTCALAAPLVETAGDGRSHAEREFPDHELSPSLIH
jgi:hypothetical protein